MRLRHEGAEGASGVAPGDYAMGQIRQDLSNHPSIDPAALNELRAFQEPGEPDIVAELIEIFLDDCPGRLEAIRAGVEQNDAAAVAASAHALKSSCAQLGVLRMSAMCQYLEAQGKAGDLDGTQEIVVDLLDEFQHVHGQLSKSDDD